uniref:Uncharacterized protein n=1 Tax=Oryza brachyantha TaxID=4533 RepID=J3NEH5_ORYBR
MFPKFFLSPVKFGAFFFIAVSPLLIWGRVCPKFELGLLPISDLLLFRYASDLGFGVDLLGSFAELLDQHGGWWFSCW